MIKKKVIMKGKIIQIDSLVGKTRNDIGYRTREGQ